MMKERVTELVFILDRSGSMSGLESDTIGGFNSMLRKQKELSEPCLITTVLFDNEIKLLHDRVSFQGVKELSDKEYQVGGSTALLDAIGMSIHKIKNAQENVIEGYQSDNILFVIITDGEENSSKEYDVGTIKKLISLMQEKHQWEFLFLGANIDAVSTAQDFGISEKRAQNYHADKEGVMLNFQVMSETVASLRKTSVLSDAWNQEIDEDFSNRK